MVSRVGGYFGLPFKGYNSVTQGYHIFPTLSNLIIGAVIFHWVKMAAKTEEGTKGLGMLIQDLAAYFHARDGIFALTQP